MLHFVQHIHDKKVVIIDEEVDTCLLLRTFFLKKNCAAYVAHTLEDGLQRVRDIAPDVVMIEPGSWGKRLIVDMILKAAPGVELIVGDREILYNHLESR